MQGHHGRQDGACPLRGTRKRPPFDLSQFYWRAWGCVEHTSICVTDKPNPQTETAPSKLKAELALRDRSSASGVELVCIRPPLVYGPGAPGNLGSLLNLIRRAVPLPLGAVNNKRSMVAVNNLNAFCADHPAAAGQEFLVSDGDDLSTSGLVRLLTKAEGRRTVLIPIPAYWLQAALEILER